MVIEDNNHSFELEPQDPEKEVEQPKAPKWPLASPVDRLAANIVDLAILVPLLSLGFAFFKREIFLAELIGTKPELEVMVMVYFGLSLAVCILFQTIFVAWAGATPGKYFFSIKVVDVWSHGNPHWQRAFLRAVLWWVDIFLVLPFIAIFADIKRRPIHDRLSDTIVLAKVERAVTAPRGYETQIARSFFAALFVFVSVYFLVHSPKIYFTAARTGMDVSDWVGEKHLCADIDNAIKAWPHSKNEGHRLKIAMSLYGAQEIDSKCLEKEADHYIWIETKGQNTNGLGYLAKAFAKIDSPELSDKYLSEVCTAEEESEACLLSRVISYWSEEKWDEIANLFSQSSIELSSYVKIWQVRHYFKMGQFDRVHKIVESMSPNYALSNFLGEYRIKVQWRTEKNTQAQAGFKMFWENNSGEERLPTASWLCYEEVAKNCQGWQSASCQVVQKSIDSYPTLLEEPKVALAKFRSLQCDGMGADHLGVLFSDEVLEYAESTDIVKKDRKEVFENLILFATDSGRSASVQFDALSRAVNLATEEGDFAKLEQTWSKSRATDSWAWKHLGHRLFDQMLKYSQPTLAAKVAGQLYKHGDHSSKNYENLARAQFRLGDKGAAWEWLKKITDEKNMRQPASTRMWQQHKQELKKEFGEQ